MDASVHPIIPALVAEGLRRMAPEIPIDDLTSGIVLSEPQVPSRLKIALVERAFAHGGAPLVLRLGRVFLDPDLPPHPLLLLFRNADTVEDFLGKIDDLYRFMHSEHRLRVVTSGPREIVLDHLDGDRLPSPLESLWVCGLLAAGLTHLGCRGLRVTLPLTGDPHPIIEDDRCRAPRDTVGAHRFAFVWDHKEPRTSVAGLERYLLGTANLVPVEPSGTVRDQVRRLVAPEPARRWTLDRAASELGYAPRTLQRALASEGTTFRELLAEIRLDSARRLLLETPMSITDVGVVAGFADSAHFSRRFREATGMSPSDWRQHHGQ